jgi:sulfhydrogenase subunit gamma (sulfur reductase)
MTTAGELHDVTVDDAWDETPALRGIRLALGDGGGAHTRPGQLIRVAGRAGESIFALANAPRDDRRVELLVKRSPGLADELIAAATPGAVVRASPPFGPGFAVEEARGRDVLLFAAGSGITPVRALLQWLLERGGHGRVALYYGQRTEQDFAYAREHAEWQARGVHLVLCLSQPSPSWHGARGYVQTVARELKLHEIAVDNAVAFLCGMKPMIDAVRDELVRFGMPAARTHLNY